MTLFSGLRNFLMVGSALTWCFVDSGQQEPLMYTQLFMTEAAAYCDVLVRFSEIDIFMF